MELATKEWTRGDCIANFSLGGSHLKSRTGYTGLAPPQISGPLGRTFFQSIWEQPELTSGLLYTTLS